MDSPHFTQGSPHMASIYRTKNGYRAQVAIMGTRDSKTLPTKREAEAWAAQRETHIRTQSKKTPAEKHTLGELLEKYSEEVVPSFKGARWSLIRLSKLLRDPFIPRHKLLSDLQPEDFIAWRDNSLKRISNGSVLRELGLLNTSLEWARKELRWINNNPIKDVSKPKAPKHREIVISRTQIRQMLVALGYSPRARRVTEVRQSVAISFLFALRTGMRASELCNLKWDKVNKQTCSLLDTKTNPREVPLSKKALRILEKIKGYDEVSVFGIKRASHDTMFRKYRDRAGLEGFTFHDSRHTAATMIARALDVLDLCKMFGWSDPKMAIIYYNPSAIDIATRINSHSSPAKRHQSRK